MKPASLLRWYPRAWRERYGGELLVLIQDTLDEGQPAWRLRLGVIRGGVRERGRQAWRTAISPRRPAWGSMVLAGLVGAMLAGQLAASPPPARAWQAVALVALLAALALTGALVLAEGLAALPALVRFLRAGGWPKIRRLASWAAGATAAAGGGLAGLVLVSGSRSFTHLDDSWAYLAAQLVTGLVMAAAIGLWAATATTAARHLTLSPRVRATQLVLGAVIPLAARAVMVTLCIWWWLTQSSLTLLVLALINLALTSTLAPVTIGRAVRKARRLRAAALTAAGAGRPGGAG